MVPPGSVLMAASRRREAVHRPGRHLAAGRSQEHADHPVSIRHGEALPARQPQRSARGRSEAALRAWSRLLTGSPPLGACPSSSGSSPRWPAASRRRRTRAARSRSAAKLSGEERRLAAAVHPEAVRAGNVPRDDESGEHQEARECIAVPIRQLNHPPRRPALPVPSHHRQIRPTRGWLGYSTMG